MVERGNIHTILLNRVESKTFFPYQLLSLLTNCLQPFCLCHITAVFAISYNYFQAKSPSNLSNCMLLFLWPRCTWLSAFAYSYSVHLSNARESQYSSLSLVNSGIPCLFLYFLLPMTYILSREDLKPWIIFLTPPFFFMDYIFVAHGQRILKRNADVYFSLYSFNSHKHCQKSIITAWNFTTSVEL